MATQSSKETRSRASELSKAIGSYHTDLDIDDVFNAQKSIFTKATGFEAKFKVHGGSITENLALQNIQARSRMVTAYEFSQLLPTIVCRVLSLPGRFRRPIRNLERSVR